MPPVLQIPHSALAADNVCPISVCVSQSAVLQVLHEVLGALVYLVSLVWMSLSLLWLMISFQRLFLGPCCMRQMC